MTIRVGSAGANAALASLGAGMNVRLLGSIGEDQLGRWLCEELAPALANELVEIASETTGRTLALESPARDRSFVTYLGVNARWEAARVPHDAVSCDNLLLCDFFKTSRPARSRTTPAREVEA